MKLTLLGAGVPTPTARRFGSAYLLQIADRNILVDCGPATTHKLVQAGGNPADVSMLLFTHHHFDHNADYPCFVLTRWDQDIEQTPLRVYGPPPTAAFTDKLFAAPDGAFVTDWSARLQYPGSQQVFANRGAREPRRAPRIDAVDIDANFTLTEDKFAIRAGHAVHVQPYLESIAYRFDTEDGSIVFTGDTEPAESVIELARGADMLVCMCWDTEAAAAANREIGGVTNTTSAGKMAAEAGVSTLVLSHINGHLDTPGVREAGIRDVAAVFDGEIVFGEELQTLELSGASEGAIRS